MRSQAAKDRRALKRERDRYMPNMPFREYVKANAAHAEREAERKQRNADYANQILGAYLSPAGQPNKGAT